MDFMNKQWDKTNIKKDTCPLLSWPVEQGVSRLSNRLGVQTYKSRQRVIVHAHPFYEVALINRGSCIHQFRSRKEVLIPGDCFLIPLYEPHAYSIYNETEIINCLFQADVLDICQTEFGQLTAQQQPFARLLDPGQDWQVIHLPPRKLTYVRCLLQQISRDVRPVEGQPMSTDQSDLDDLVGYHGLMLLLLELTRLSAGYSIHQTDRHIDPGSERIQAKSDDGRQVISKLLAYMQTNLQHPISMRQLAEHIHLSEGHCRRLFVRYTGYAPMAFLSRLRLNHALILLEKGSYSVKAVAEQVGYSDPGYFARVFRRQMQAVPRDFLPHA
ncbi:MAG: AraC family transcriptional regulator [Bacillota bacterium]|nr:AraC family transcriptional regulator [Bacillota bacterium]